MSTPVPASLGGAAHTSQGLHGSCPFRVEFDSYIAAYLASASTAAVESMEGTSTGPVLTTNWTTMPGIALTVSPGSASGASVVVPAPLEWQAR